MHSLEREIPAGAAGAGIPAGTRSLSVFLVNRRAPDAEQPDHAYVFQPELQISCEAPFVPRPDLRGANADEWDELVADLHYADTPEYATGHGVAADWEILDGDCRVLRTRWIPGADVEKTVTAAIPDVELRMSVLGALADGAAAREALTPLVTRYRAWIATQQTATSRSGWPAAGDGRRVASCRWPGRRPHRAWHRRTRRRRGRARCVPGRQPGGRGCA